MAPIRILYEDPYLVLCVKPVGVLSEDSPAGACMPGLLREHYRALGQNDYIATVHRLDRLVGGVAEQQVSEGGFVLCRRAPENGQVFLGDAVLRHGGGELSGDVPAAGEQHNAAHQPVQPVDGGDIVVLPRCAVVLPQKGGHTGTGVAVLGQHAHGLDAQHKVGVLVENTDRLHGRISGGGHGRRGGGSGCRRPCRSGGCARRGGTTARGLRP